MRITRTAQTLFLAALLGAASCSSFSPHGGSDEREDSRTKQVAAKVEPNYLIAHDYSECQVTKQRYDEVRVGDRITCSWYSPRDVTTTR